MSGYGLVVVTTTPASVTLHHARPLCVHHRLVTGC